jgi:hypothetical protein
MELDTCDASVNSVRCSRVMGKEVELTAHITLIVGMPQIRQSVMQNKNIIQIITRTKCSPEQELNVDQVKKG